MGLTCGYGRSQFWSEFDRALPRYKALFDYPLWVLIQYRRLECLFVGIPRLQGEEDMDEDESDDYDVLPMTSGTWWNAEEGSF